MNLPSANNEQAPQKSAYGLARAARKQQPETESQMKPPAYLKNEQSIQQWRKDAAV